MSKHSNLNAITIYFRPKQLNSLRELKQLIKEEHQVHLSIAELVRESVDNFLEGMTSPEDVEIYLDLKGW